MSEVANPTPILNQIIQENAAEEAKVNPDEVPVTVEPPQLKASGLGVIQYQCTKEQSLEITGNGIGGHDRINWDRRYADQVQEARDKFYELLEKGWKAFLTREDGSATNKRLFKFVPDAEEIIMVAPHHAG